MMHTAAYKNQNKSLLFFTGLLSPSLGLGRQPRPTSITCASTLALSFVASDYCLLISHSSCERLKLNSGTNAAG